MAFFVDPGLTSLQMSAFINPWFINDWVEASGTYLSEVHTVYSPTDS